eukprot:TRINITY_DN12031_c0_g1_i1.p1 TRINITY_DN12031_c0_g1~~TRINITY_DN12031_c0_g1_i1.p1  ORF type:complete len:913 (+),score=178.72 TRINITY_DN12031_c0_g1_i1:242-2740(+)
MDVVEEQITKSFIGHAVIDVEFLSPTSCIQINAANLTMSSLTVSVGGSLLDLSDVEKDEVNQRLTIVLPAAFSAGTKAQIVASYVGVIPLSTDYDHHGFYSTPMPDIDGKKQFMYDTQFQPSFSRYAFPSFDEPYFKSTYEFTFKVTSEIPNLTILANTKETSITKAGNLTVAVFSKSPVAMSSYLVCWCIAVLDYTEYIDPVSNIRYRAYSSPSTVNYTDWGLMATKNAVDFFTTKFGIGFPFNKLDSVVNPEYGGAMEHYGLIVYGPGSFLVTPTTSNMSKLGLTDTILHEVAHQWVGNLVTCQYWDQAYLNEGFATSYSFVAMTNLYPQFDSLSDAVLYYSRANYLDASGAYNPVIKPSSIWTSDQFGFTLGGAFDTLTYNKGGSVNRYFTSVLGTKWDESMSHHLSTWKYKSVTEQDLINSFLDEGVDISSKLTSWINQPGFPVVDLTLSTTNGVLLLGSQSPNSRFLAQDSTWYIQLCVDVYGKDVGTPKITYCDDNLPDGNKWDKTINLNLNNNNDILFMIPNPKLYGFFTYSFTSSSEWTSLIDAIGTDPRLTNPDRIGVFWNILTLVVSGHQPIELALNVTKSLSASTDEWLLQSLVVGWSSITPLLVNQPDYRSTQAELAAVFEQFANYVNWSLTDNPEVSNGVRDNILFRAAYYGAQSVITKAKDIYNKNETSSSMRTVYWSVVRYGLDSDYNKLYQEYKLNPSGSMMYGLCAPKSTDLCAQTIELISNSDLSIDAKIAYANTMLAFNPECKYVAWGFLSKNYNAIYYAYPIPDYFVNVASSESDLFVLQGFFASDAGSRYDETYKSSRINAVKFNVDFANK